MIKEIGSTYFLDPKVVDSLPKRSKKSPDIIKKGESYVSTCRSAIGICLDTLSLERKVALLPAFTCESVLGPFLKRGYEVHPYPIGRDLNIHWDSFSAKVKEINPAVILVHSYFGFNSMDELRDAVDDLRKDGTIIIEDMTQSMFSKCFPLLSDFHVGSIRKWMPIPDGAFVTVPYSCSEADTELEIAKLKALTEKGNWIINGVGDKAEFRKNFSKAEHILDSRERPYSMSSASREIYAATDIELMRKTRWANYKYLENEITRFTKLKENLKVIFTIKNEDVCPFHFPIYVESNRKELQQYLAQNDIYATIIWGCPDEFVEKINEDARYIYDHILCFHVDQRYGIDDMKRIVDTLKTYYKI